jgi:hypothetical protein
MACFQRVLMASYWLTYWHRFPSAGDIRIRAAGSWSDLLRLDFAVAAINARTTRSFSGGGTRAGRRVGS